MSRIATIRRRSLGAAFLALIVGLLALTILFYNHAFTKTVDVTLYAGCQPPPAAAGTGPTSTTQTATDLQPQVAPDGSPMCTTTSVQNNSAGHELDVPADVKLRGIVVGQVHDITLADSNRRAVLHLKLMPSQVGNIPANVSAQIIPKTLFGEKYVDLVIPSNPTSMNIAQGNRRIVQSATSIEAEQVFNDLLPLLQTVQPAELNTTLSNLAQALRGRGNLLGDNLARTDTYFSGLNPDLGNITTDVGGLQTLAENLNDATPDILAQARQFSVNARTLVEKGDVFAHFLTGTQGFATTATDVLTRNETNLVQLAKISQPTLAVLAEFSPELTCTLQGLSDQSVLLKDAISPHGNDKQYALHINVTVPADNARHAYTPADTPKNEAQNVRTTIPGGPCFGLPGRRTEPIPAYLPINGTPTPGNPPASAGSASPASATGTSPLTMARILAAPQLGVRGQDVPDLAALLLAPALAGGAVSVTAGGSS